METLRRFVEEEKIESIKSEPSDYGKTLKDQINGEGQIIPFPEEEKTEKDVINDNVIASDRTWSSERISSEIEQVRIETQINTEDILDIKENLQDINSYLPPQVSDENQLADKDFVNSSIGTNTANFLGTFDTLEEIEALTDMTNNDYAFWKTTDTEGNVVYKRYKYNEESEECYFEYDLNNSSFTSDQWKSINSGITEELVEKIDQIENPVDVLEVGNMSAVTSNAVKGALNDIAVSVMSSGNPAMTGSSLTIEVENSNYTSEVDGMLCKLLITSEIQSSVAIDTVNIKMNGGTEYPIKVMSNNSLVNITSSQMTAGADYNASYPHRWCDKFTKLELTFCASQNCWIANGDDILMSYNAENEGYTKKTNLLIEQWGFYYYNAGGRDIVTVVNLPLRYGAFLGVTRGVPYNIMITPSTWQGYASVSSIGCYITNEYQFHMRIYGIGSNDNKNNGIYYKTIGY